MDDTLAVGGQYSVGTISRQDKNPKDQYFVTIHYENQFLADRTATQYGRLLA